VVARAALTQRLFVAHAAARLEGCFVLAVPSSPFKGIPADRFGYMHICDAPAASPPTTSAMLNEARTLREFPGEGELPLVPLLRALPAGLTVSVELGTHNRGSDADTRARLGAEATRRIIALADEDA
jgi:hypothetical protein